jgi:hypothetical protein
MTLRKKPVGLALLPRDHARLRAWAEHNRRSMTNAAETIILERLAADEPATPEPHPLAGEVPLWPETGQPDTSGPNWGAR